MSRRLQHLAPTDAVKSAERDGRKVNALCGARHYPMTSMGDHVPTCTPCNRALLREHDKVVAELGDANAALARADRTGMIKAVVEFDPGNTTFSGRGKPRWRWVR